MHPHQQRVPFPKPHLPRMKVFAVIMRRFVPRFIIRDRNLSHAVKWNYVLREKANATPYGSGSAQCATPRCVCVCAVRSLRICINSDISYEQPTAGASSRPARVFPPHVKGLRVSVPFWPAVPLSIASPCFFFYSSRSATTATRTHTLTMRTISVFHKHSYRLPFIISPSPCLSGTQCPFALLPVCSCERADVNK